MGKIEEFSLFGLYGNTKIFKKKLDEGFTEFACGRGEWVNIPKQNNSLVSSQRIVGAFIFYHPNGKISTYEHPKMDDGYTTFHGTPFEAEYDQKGFKNHLDKFEMKVYERGDLGEFIKKFLIEESFK